MAMPVQDVLYNISWQNLILYSAATPQYDDEKENENFDASKDACDPNNFAGSEDEEYFY